MEIVFQEIPINKKEVTVLFIFFKNVLLEIGTKHKANIK